MTGQHNKIMSWLADNADFTPISQSWSNIKTPAAQYYTLKTLTIPAYSQYMIMAQNGNGVGGASTNSCRLIVSSGTPLVSQLMSGLNNSGAGNIAHAMGYIKTGATPCVVTIQCYGYNTSVTNMNGNAVAIPLVKNFGGGRKQRPNRWKAVAA